MDRDEIDQLTKDMRFLFSLEEKALFEEPPYCICQGCEEEKKRTDAKRCGGCFHVFFCDKKCQKKGWAWHKRSCYTIDRTLYKNRKNTALHEALKQNLLQEYQALVTFAKEKGERESDFAKGRRLTFEGITGMIKLDPMRGNAGDCPEDDAFRDTIREGGILLNRDGGMRSMKDPLVFSFIPRRFHGDLNHLWDGIGEWLA